MSCAASATATPAPGKHQGTVLRTARGGDEDGGDDLPDRNADWVHHRAQRRRNVALTHGEPLARNLKSVKATQRNRRIH